jgi:hypothetical protein
LKSNEANSDAIRRLCEEQGLRCLLELPKVCQVVSDGVAAKLQQIRVIDESGEGYLYPEEFFVAVQLPQSTEKSD